jgi:hypothetical protein
MKSKILFSFLLALAGFFTAEAQSWPFGKADYQTATIAVDSTVSADIDNRMTYLTLPTINNNITVHLDVDKLQKGAFLYVELPNGAVAKTVTWGDKINGPVLTGTVNKTKICGFLWDGTVFRKVSEALYD